MSKQLFTFSLCNPNIRIDLSERYQRNDVVNPVVMELLENSYIKMKINTSKRKNIVMIKDIITALHYLSVSLNIRFSMEIEIEVPPIKKGKKGETITWDNPFMEIKYDNGLIFKRDMERDSVLKEFELGTSFFSHLARSNKPISLEPFYTPNVPEDKEGYVLKEVSEDFYKYEKKYVYQKLNKNIKSNRTHYLKWKYNEDISIRYFFLFEDRKQLEGNYYIKSHSKKEYILLTEKQAELMINQLHCSEVEEIIGIISNGNYKKIYINKTDINISVE